MQWNGSTFSRLEVRVGVAAGAKAGFQTAVSDSRVLYGLPGEQRVTIRQYDESTQPLLGQFASPLATTTILEPTPAGSAGFGEFVDVDGFDVVVAAPYSSLSAEPGLGALHAFTVGRVSKVLATELFSGFGQGFAPRLRVGTSPLCAGESMTLNVSSASVPLAEAGILVVGFAELSAPAKGGVLYPQPFKFLNVPLPPPGGLDLPAILPTGAPEYALFLQAWYPATGAFPAGFVASAGMRIDVPSDL